MSHHTEFPRVPDSSSPDFNAANPQHVAEAKYQRVRETKIALEEVCRALWLQWGVR